jgi:hypothetical protein
MRVAELVGRTSCCAASPAGGAGCSASSPGGGQSAAGRAAAWSAPDDLHIYCLGGLRFQRTGRHDNSPELRRNVFASCSDICSSSARALEPRSPRRCGRPCPRPLGVGMVLAGHQQPLLEGRADAAPWPAIMSCSRRSEAWTDFWNPTASDGNREIFGPKTFRISDKKLSIPFQHPMGATPLCVAPIGPGCHCRASRHSVRGRSCELTAIRSNPLLRVGTTDAEGQGRR